MNGHFDPSRLDLYQSYKDENGQDLRISLVHSYLKTTAQELEKLKALSAQDQAAVQVTVQRIAHTLKSSSAAVGGLLLATFFAELEAEIFSLDQLSKKLQVIESGFADLKVSLEKYLEQLPQ
jgi:HPt (histidine-containing phosphotransfer) domain-containing protein